MARAKENRNAATRKTGAGRGEAVLLPPAKGCPPPGRGQALAAGTPGGSRGKGGMALLLGWQRDEVERGKCLGEIDVQKQKTALGFEGKGRKFSAFSCTSFSPPSTASSN